MIRLGWPAFALVIAGWLTAVGSGCTGRCFKNVDCGQGSFCIDGRCETECFDDRDCREPPECADNPTACTPKGLRCTSTGRCVGPIVPPDTELASGQENPFDSVVDGFDDPPGTGAAFIVDRLVIADADQGFDVDGKCTDDGCIDNVLGELGSIANTQIQQGIRSGESLLLMELVGLESPYQGNETSATVKIYGARDADVPVFPADNFRVPEGAATCCNFNISPQSLINVPPQAGARSPVQIVKGRLESLAPVPIQFILTIGAPPHPEIRINRVRVRATVPGDLGGLADGVLGGSVPVNTLASIDNPYCRAGESSQCPREVPSGSTLIDLVAIFIGPRPDIDGDADGLECIRDDDGDGIVDGCCDAQQAERCPLRSSACVGGTIPPSERSRPNSCAKDPRMADGYSIALKFRAVAANIVGIAN